MKIIIEILWKVEHIMTRIIVKFRITLWTFNKARKLSTVAQNYSFAVNHASSVDDCQSCERKQWCGKYSQAFVPVAKYQ